MFPGLYCPGLIEGPSTTLSTVTVRRFRGSIAPASLKGSEIEGTLAAGTGFPGLYCPGLL